MTGTIVRDQSITLVNDSNESNNAVGSRIMSKSGIIISG